MPVASVPAVLPRLVAFAALLPVAADATGIPFAKDIADRGISGIIILILLVVIRQIDKREREGRAELTAKCEALQAARLDDAKVYRDGVIAATGRVYDAVKDLNEVAERLESRGGGR